MSDGFAIRRSLLLAPLALLVVGLFAVALPSSSDAVTCKLKGSKKVKCPNKQLQGPAGPAGPQGPVAGDPSAPKVTRFTFLATGGAPNTVIQNFNGAVAESGCAASTFSQPRIRSTANNGAVETVNIRTEGFSSDPDFDSSQVVDLIPGNNDDQFDFTYLAAGGAQVATGHFAALDGVGLSGQFDCALFGMSTVG